ncbi:MAG: copper homeostasis protein CutC [Bacteroidales bacterium]|nr:copper homeostasis protein CutC [Bacteroidales bacterium]MDD4669720.1 copper homeostasis protein CutC [Bacteroidales bacterium]
MNIEICAENINAAIEAQNAGADRIELCFDLSVGGISPTMEEMIEAKSRLNITTNVLLRPRGGDFVFSAREIDEIMTGIETCGQFGFSGVVIGALNSDGTVNMPVCRQMVEFARKLSLSVTFHRAIDCTSNIFSALEDVISLGVDRVLTSGGSEGAFQGADTIARMVKQASGRTIIMAGAGVTPDNVVQLIEKTSVTEVHGSRIAIIRALRCHEQK